jgi:hypothetical protein
VEWITFGRRAASNLPPLLCVTLRVTAILSLLLAALGASLSAQVNTGELRVRITDADGRGLKALLRVSSAENQYRNQLVTNDAGSISIKPLRYGTYLIVAEKPGFAASSVTLEVRSAIPAERSIALLSAPLTSEVKVSDTAPLIDPYQPSSVNQIGAQQIQTRVASLPGRSLQDLVNSQPGWLYEGNAVLHPRGSEYQTQFVVDGIPLTDNRSPGSGPEVEADEVESMTVYTSGLPAEYGRKMGGVVEVNTERQTSPGVRGDLALSGGSYQTAQSMARLQDVWGANALLLTASGAQTAHYLNPVVPQNYTNRGTTGDFSAQFERELSPRDRLTSSVRHELSRFEIPNELVQQQAGQLQTGDNFETIGTLRYQHIFSDSVLANVAAMVRSSSHGLGSNAASTPIVAFLNNNSSEAYFKATVSIHRKRHEWKAGIDSDTAFLHENFSYAITDATRYDDGTPPSLVFTQSHPDWEQSAFVEDLVRLGNWTVSAGIRWDHYQLLLNRSAVSPRLSVSRYLPKLNAVLHFSYDRVFQTPDNQNLLLSSSPLVLSLNPNVLRLPVQPSHGNYYEGGISKGFSERVRVDVNVFRREIANYSDDDQLLNTSVSYPISFNHAVIYGAEAKLSLVHFGKLSGFASYSYMVGAVWNPVTGGLFLGDDATQALAQLSGHFPDSQDQRNTLRARVQYAATQRLWLATGLSSGSGLPFQFSGTYSDALADYGSQVTNRVNFARGRVAPSLAMNASASVELYKTDHRSVRFQIDGENLNNRLNVIDFGGLFSGNAIAPKRSCSLRLNTTF